MEENANNISINSNDTTKRNQQRLKQIKNQIYLSQKDLDNLLNSDLKNKFTLKVLQFNHLALQNIQNDLPDEALVYLIEAEKILEKAAETNKQFSKSIIICTLHNLACCYQKNWDLQACSNYIQALIFNLNSSLKGFQTSPASAINELSNIKIGGSISPKGLPQKAIQLMISIENRQRLGRYYLQFCAVNSQIKNHSGALIAARKSIQIMKKMFKQLTIFLKHHNNKISKQTRQQFESKLRLVHQLSKINDNINVSQYQMILQTTKYYLRKWSLNQESQNFLSQRSIDLQAKFKNFSIGSIAQMHPISTNSLFQTSQYNKIQLTKTQNIVEKVLVVVIAYFTISTQLRLLAQNKNPISQVSDTHSNANLSNQPQFRQAEIFHLFSIMLSAIFIPFQILYMKHILLSYKNHYNIDLFQEKVDYGDNKLYQDFLFTISQIKKHSLLGLDLQDSLRISQIGNEVFMHDGGTQIRFTKSSNSDNLKKFSLIANSQNKNKNKKSKSNKRKSKSKSKSKVKKETVKTISALSAHSKNKQKLEPTNSKSPQIHTQSSLGKSKNKKSLVKTPRNITSLQMLTEKQAKKKSKNKEVQKKKHQYGGIKTSQIKKKKNNNGVQQTNAYFLQKRSKSKPKRSSNSLGKQIGRDSKINSKKQLFKGINPNNPTDIYFHKVQRQKASKSKSKQKILKNKSQSIRSPINLNSGSNLNNKKSIYSHYS